MSVEHPASRHGASSSWPSKTHRADTAHPPETPDSLSRPLTERDGVSLREEVRDLDRLDGARPLSWRGAVRQWRQYILDRRDTDTIFQNQRTGEYAAGGDPHRFDPDYASKQYAKLKDLERGLRDEYGKRLHTAMLSLTASSTDAHGRPLPPVDHLDQLLSSWDAVRRELARQLDGRRWEYLAILEPHESGYLHVHIAVFVDGVVTQSDLAPVVEAHVHNCDLAETAAHEPDDDGTISINRVGLDRHELHAAAEGAEIANANIGNLGTYLAEYLGTYGDDPLEAPPHQQMSNAVLWATGRQRWRPSQGAQSYMAYDGASDPDDGESPWEVAGVVSGTEYHPVEGDPSGGVDRFVTATDPPD